MQRRIVPSSIGEDSIESFLISHGRRRFPLYSALLIIVSAAGASLPMLKTEVSVHARGIIRPSVEKHEINAPISGQVEAVAARRGHHLREGDTLLVLRSATVRGRARLLEQQREAKRIEIADLELLARGPLRREYGLRLRTPRVRQWLEQLDQELAVVEARRAQALRQRDRSRLLYDRGLAPRAEMEDHELLAQEALADSAILVERHRGQWQAELAAARQRVLDLQGELHLAAEEARMHVIRAPLAGSVEEMASVSPGSHVVAGERLAVISPRAPLTAEVLVSPSDIGLLRTGSDARLHIDAFHYTDWGFVTGRISEIPSDFQIVDRQPFFRVLVRMDGNELRLGNGYRGELKKGMTLTARFVVARRSLWQLLRDDVNDWLDPTRAYDAR